MRLLSLLLTAGSMLLPATAIADTGDLRRIGVIVELAVNVDTSRADSLGAAMADALNRELRVDAMKRLRAGAGHRRRPVAMLNDGR